MSDKIPTAEKYGESLLPRGIIWYKEFDEMMIEFAQLHVEAALKAAKAHVEEVMEGSTFMSGDILNIYPKEKII